MQNSKWTYSTLGVERVWKYKDGSGIGYQLNFNYGSERVRVYVKLYQKNLESLAKWSIDTKVLNVCHCNIKFMMATDFFGIFYHMLNFKSYNIFFEVGKYHSWPNTLPFQVGYWGAITRTPKSDPSTRSSPNIHADKT